MGKKIVNHDVLGIYVLEKIEYQITSEERYYPHTINIMCKCCYSGNIYDFIHIKVELIKSKTYLIHSDFVEYNELFRNFCIRTADSLKIFVKKYIYTDPGVYAFLEEYLEAIKILEKFKKYEKTYK